MNSSLWRWLVVWLSAAASVGAGIATDGSWPWGGPAVVIFAAISLIALFWEMWGFLGREL